MARYGRRDAQGGSCAQTCHRQLYAHGQSQFVARKPAYHRLGDGNAGHLIAYAEYGEAQGGERHRGRQVEMRNDE